MFHYRGCGWGEGNGERCLKWGGGGCGGGVVVVVVGGGGGGGLGK